MQGTETVGIPFGKYQLYARLATGGMAELFLAKQPGIGGFSRTIVLKCILPHLAREEQFITMFLDEARVVSHLNHPHIVQIYEIGQTQDLYYIAMEYIRGRDLKTFRNRLYRHIGDAPPPYPVLTNIISQAASGLHYAHCATDERGTPLRLVHRDISPHNLLLSYNGVTKIVDFGVAKAATQEHKTSAGTVKGKYRYMSPEQLNGRDIDHRSDIFSLGIVLYELTTNHSLFRRNSEVETIQAISFGDIPLPREICAAYPPHLERIVMKALERDIHKRYQTCEELRLDLEHFTLQQGAYQAGSLLQEWMEALFAAEMEQGHSEVSQPLTSKDIARLSDGDYSGSMPSFRSGIAGYPGAGLDSQPSFPGALGKASPHSQDGAMPHASQDLLEARNREPKGRGLRALLLGLLLFLLLGFGAFYGIKAWLWPQKPSLTRGNPDVDQPLPRLPHNKTNRQGEQKQRQAIDEALRKLETFLTQRNIEATRLQQNWLTQQIAQLRDPLSQAKYKEKLKGYTPRIQALDLSLQAKQLLQKKELPQAAEKLRAALKLVPNDKTTQTLLASLQRRSQPTRRRRVRRRSTKRRRVAPPRRRTKIAMLPPPKRRETYGYAAINSSPIGAEVYIKGELIGFTPINRHKLPPGQFRVRFKKKGHLDISRTITITGSKKQYLRVELRPAPERRRPVPRRVLVRATPTPQRQVKHPRYPFNAVRLLHSKRLRVFITDPSGHVGRQSTGLHRRLCQQIEREVTRLMGQDYSVGGVTRHWQNHIRRRMKLDSYTFYPRAVAYVIYNNLARGRSRERVGHLLVSYHKRKRFRRIRR